MPQYPAIIELSNLDGNNGFEIDGEAMWESSGRSVSSAGDMNGDGFGDIIVGAYNADPNGQASGASYVVFGMAANFGATLELSNRVENCPRSLNITITIRSAVPSSFPSII